MGLGIPHLKSEIMLESRPLKSRILVRRLAAGSGRASERARCGVEASEQLLRGTKEVPRKGFEHRTT